jgi:hypothetical protein
MRQQERSWWTEWCQEVYKHADSHQSDLHKIREQLKDKDVAFRRTLGTFVRLLSLPPILLCTQFIPFCLKRTV